MNKWLARLVGTAVLLLIVLVFGDKWFNPAVPPALEDSGAAQRAAQNAARNQQQQAAPPPAETPAQPEITLTSLQDMESDKGAPPPALTNPQGKSPQAQGQQPVQTREQVKLPAEPPPLTLTSLDEPAAEKPAKEPAKEAPKQAPAQLQNSKASAWVQAGSFGERENAEQLAASLRKSGFTVDIASATVNGRKYNRVYVGPLPDNQVDAALQKLSRMGVNARPVTR